MAIAIGTAQLKLISNHAENVYPEECCGILVGKIDGLTKTVVEVIPTINVWEQSELADEIDRTKHSRYTISAQAVFQAQKWGRDLHLEIIGFFHSHPDNPAIPSTCDRQQAWEVYSYPIVSVIEGKVSDLKSWVLDPEGSFQEEKIQVITDH